MTTKFTLVFSGIVSKTDKEDASIYLRILIYHLIPTTKDDTHDSEKKDFGSKKIPVIS